MRATEAKRTALKSTGSRVTKQRALILDIVSKAHRHLDADQIYYRARSKQPRLSLSTVYRNLKALKELGLIEEIDFDETHHHYEAKPPIQHYHLVCLGCSKIIEFQYPLSQYIKTHIAEAKDFKIVDTDIRLTGYCSKCQQETE